MNTENLKLILGFLERMLTPVLTAIVLYMTSQQNTKLDRLEVQASSVQTSVATLPKIKIAADNAALYARSADVSAQEAVDNTEGMAKP